MYPLLKLSELFKCVCFFHENFRAPPNDKSRAERERLKSWRAIQTKTKLVDCYKTLNWFFDESTKFSSFDVGKIDELAAISLH